MSDIATLTIDPPLPCCRLLARLRRCGTLTTIAQATRQQDGSYYLQPICPSCAAPREPIRKQEP